MRSTEFVHGAYTIKAFLNNGEARARAFQDGVWLRAVSDWTAESVENAVQRMRASLDALEAGEEFDAAPFDSQTTVASVAAEGASALVRESVPLASLPDGVCC